MHFPSPSPKLLLYPLPFVSIHYMSRDYKPLPPLWRIQEVLALTDEHPSGLLYIKKNRPVKRLHRHSGFYLVSIDAEVYQAHRIVYALRTGELPDKCCISHNRGNSTKDNRMELKKTWIKREPKKPKQNWSWND